MDSYPRRRMRTLMSMGLAVKGAVVARPSTPVVGIGRSVLQVDAARRDEREMRVDCAQLGHERCQIVHRHLVELDAVDARFSPRRRASSGPRLYEGASSPTQRPRQDGKAAFPKETPQSRP